MRDERRKTLRKTPRSSRCKVGERDGVATPMVACGRGRMRRGWTKLTSRECTLRRCAVVDWIPIDSLKALTDGFVRGERSIETQRKNEAGRGQGLTTCDSSRTQEQAKPGEGKQRKYIDENIDENAWKYLTGTMMFAGRVQQADTRSFPSVGGAIVWNETFEFEGVTGDEELCLHLCNRKKKGKTSYKRIAACGLYLKDVLKARLPLRNRFQMFDPKKNQQAGELGLHLSWKDSELSARGPGTCRCAERHSGSRSSFECPWQTPPVFGSLLLR